MLCTITGMVGSRVSGNLMSLGALDFGLIVDGAVIIVENCLRRLGAGAGATAASAAVAGAARHRSRGDARGDPAQRVRRDHHPRGVSADLRADRHRGKDVPPDGDHGRDRADGALILSLTFVPAAVALFVRGTHRGEENRLMARHAARLSAGARVGAANAAGSSSARRRCAGRDRGIRSRSRMGREFVPNLDEGDIALHALRIPGTSLTQAVEMQMALEARLEAAPRGRARVRQVGTAEVANDPMPPSVADTFVMMKPRDEWPDPRKPKAELLRELEAAAAEIPGNNYEFTQPIQMRFNELISGVRSDVAVKVYGDDLDSCSSSASRSSECSAPCRRRRREGRTGTGLPLLSIMPDRARAGALRPGDRRRAATSCASRVGGEAPGSCSKATGASTSSCVCPRRCAADPDALARSAGAAAATTARWPAMPTASAARTALRRTCRSARSREIEVLGPEPDQPRERQAPRRSSQPTCAAATSARSSHEAAAAHRARSRAARGLLARLRRHVRAACSPATQRLSIVVPLTLLLIFGLLFMAFGSGEDALIVFTGVPLALTGGVLALLAARHSAVDLGRRRLHRAVRRRGAQRRRDAVVHPRAAAARRILERRSSRRADTPAPGADDRAGGEPGLRADGIQRRHGLGGAAAARDGGDRRHHLVDAADAAGAAGAVSWPTDHAMPVPAAGRQM